MSGREGGKVVRVGEERVGRRGKGGRREDREV